MRLDSLFRRCSSRIYSANVRSRLPPQQPTLVKILEKRGLLLPKIRLSIWLQRISFLPRPWPMGAKIPLPQCRLINVRTPPPSPITARRRVANAANLETAAHFCTLLYIDTLMRCCSQHLQSLYKELEICLESELTIYSRGMVRKVKGATCLEQKENQTSWY
jgi:hypothetical protein